jgi:SCY1-like protein 1
MASFAPKLNSTNLETAVRFLNKLQGDVEPAIRTNTTYCIAKIASSLNPSLREKTLIPSFSRALKDPFPPARVAGAVSFNASMEYFSATDCARKIIPVLSPLCVDDEQEVRDIAVKGMQSMLAKLQNFSPTTPVNATQTTGHAKTPSSSDGSLNAGALIGSLGSWAVSSVASKLYGGTSPSKAQRSEAMDSSITTLPTSSTGSSPPIQTLRSNPTSNAPTTSNQADGWEEFLDETAPDESDSLEPVIALSTKKSSKDEGKRTPKRPSKKGKEKSSIISSADIASSQLNDIGNWDSWGDNLDEAPTTSPISSSPIKLSKSPNSLSLSKNPSQHSAGDIRSLTTLQTHSKTSSSNDDDWSSFLK